MAKIVKMLGVDYGEARTGLAHSDALGLYAVGMGNIKSYNMEKAAADIAAKAAEIGAELIVIGKPVNMNGTMGEKVEKVTHLGELIATHTDIPIDFYDERMTTMVAYRFLGETGTYGKKRKGAVDTLSAEIILQNYIDRERAMKGK